jgi:hypothetical protein
VGTYSSLLLSSKGKSLAIKSASQGLTDAPREDGVLPSSSRGSTPSMLGPTLAFRSSPGRYWPLRHVGAMQRMLKRMAGVGQARPRN